MKISSSLRIVVVVLLAFSLTSAASVFLQLSKMSQDGNVVDYSGRQRAFSQRITKMLFAKYSGNYDGAKIDESIKSLDKIVNGLINGDSDLKLPKATDEKYLAKMNEVSTSWSKLKKSIEQSDKDKAITKDLFEDSETFLKLANEATVLASSFSEGKVKTLKTIQIIFLILNFIMLVFIWIINHKKISDPLTELAEKSEQLSLGNLKVSIAATSNDEISTVAGSLNIMIQHFNDMINSILTSSNNVVTSVDILRVRAEKTNEGAQNQSGQASNIATAAEEMSQTITDIAKNASVAAESSTDAMDIAQSGKQITDTTVETINEVNTSTTELSDMVGKLSHSVTEIGSIVNVIKDIADQTNLLALNAAIEAARAGEQGRGFAVVADEVRKLAEKTIKATADISAKIGAVQADSELTAKSMAESSKGVTKAAGHIRNLNNVLESIVESIQKVRDQVTNIATAVEEQSSASDDVARNIETTSGIAKNMEKMSDDVMHEVNALVKISEELRNTTTGFKTQLNEQMMLDIAKTDHRVFVGKVASCLKGDISLDPSKLPDHHTCRFGKWYDTEGHDKCGKLPSFRLVDTPHAKIHAIAKEAVSLSNSGNKGKAQELYKEMEHLSDEIGSILDGIKRECS